MNSLRNLKLAYRFALLILCVVVGFAIYGLWSFKTLGELKVNGPIYKGIIQGKDLVADILPPPEYIIESYLVSLQLVSSEKSEQDELVARLKHLKEDYDTRHSYWEKENLSSDLADTLLKQAHAPVTAFYAVAFNEFVPALQRSDKEAAAAALIKMKSAYETHRKAIDRVVQIANERVESDESSANQEIRSSIVWMLTVLALSVSLAIFMAAIISRSITRPLVSMQATMLEIANSSDFTRRIDVQSEDEVGQTARTFNELVNTLQATLLRLLECAKEVSHAAEELSVSSRQVATSSGQQSSDAASMAATVEQVTVSINHVTDSALQARDLSCKSGDLSAHGSDIIHNAATAMLQIAETVQTASNTIAALGEQSNQISSVVQVIKDVAEQTNLLALNAAIEAARAGEQGRGFAVVADEVRKLAERTSHATQEISGMIEGMQKRTNDAIAAMGEAVGKADGGAVLAHQAGEAINQIKDGSSTVVGVVNDISSSLMEQSSASNDIAVHVEKVAQMAEENNAAAEQAAGAASNLEKLARDMSSIVNKFKLA